MSKVWLVTGSASGLGRKIAEAVLSSGDPLVATARDPGRLKDLVAKYSNHVRTAPLDVVDENAASAAVQVAVEPRQRVQPMQNAGERSVFPRMSTQRHPCLLCNSESFVVIIDKKGREYE